MKFEIKSWSTGAILFSLETTSLQLCVEAAIKSGADFRYANFRYANLSSANLRRADISYADFRYANLSSADFRRADISYADFRSADLRSADFRYANLGSANLRYADLGSADLRYANLRYAELGSVDLGSANLGYAKGVNKNLITPLRILLDQPGPIWGYKLINAEGEGPFNGGINYRADNDTFSVADFDSNEENQCGAGINLATLDWIMKEWKPGFRILIMEFFANEPEGNLCIPTGTDGKFRVRQCVRVGEKDLAKIGLPLPNEKQP